MSRLKDMTKGVAPVHERGLELRTYPVKNERLVVEGWLRDERFVSGYHWNGKPRPADVVHHMCVRFLVGGWPVTILDVEAEMPRIPHEMCPTTLEGVKRLVGVKIISGYTEQVKKLLGGVKGCNHMTHLIVVMGTAALHGYWTHYSREPRELPRTLEEFQGLSTLVNSCKLWGEDGPILKEIQAELEGHPQIP
ncbi:MAG: DUF2889 domain-containing protein [Desulfobacteraceae bacterium]